MKEAGRKEKEEISVRGTLDCRVKVPGSKSVTARGLIAASLAEESVCLEGVLDSDDTRRLRDALRALGTDVSEQGTHWIVRGTGGRFRASAQPLYLGGSGTAMRFLTAYAGLAQGNTILDGEERLRERPVQDLLDALSQLGVTATSLAENGCPPVRIQGGGIRGGKAVVRGNLSSQFVSAVLLAAPYARNVVTVRIEPPLISRPYVDMTLRVMEAFGVFVEEKEDLCFRVPLGTYRRERYAVEPDASSASYAFAAAAVAGGRVLVEGIVDRSIQGDAGFVTILEAMGCRVSRTDGGCEVCGPASRGVDVDMNRMPDLVPTLAVVAAAVPAVSHIRNVGHLRIKESDRLSVVAGELKKLGIRVEEGRDELTVHGGTLHEGVVDPHNDHRIAMAFAVAGLKVPGIVIEDPACVGKSFPGFWDMLEVLK